ncbi:nucleoside recognition domain-containing protein [Cohnella faecalis]|uniref:Sporulation integral membrane protein YlbJ n=1 Tax=Cohnella faecalis TaxID=2315694 RepID=A0A398CNB8_9BACL|nr:nucleoside recognition domain-containing protein [Cohnella faecalis]RIE02739.1 sporulation integral membrane protein YlbJ [Cohnella faecalis]
MVAKTTKQPAFSGISRIGAMLAVGATAATIGGLALAMPHTALQASLRGVSVWWDVLFPALFPFFVLSELLLGFGIVHLAGTLMDPLMRPLFRLPGAGGFVVAMGFASGYPVGARLTSRLMEQGLVNREQGERLVAITTTSDPIFLIGAVCIGFFQTPAAIPVLAIAHYGGAILLGLIGRLGGSASKDLPIRAQPLRTHGAGRIKAAIAAMHHARLADGRPFGAMLQQSIQSSLALMFVVGGLVVFFSASLELLVNSGVLTPLKNAAGSILHLFGLPSGMSPSLVNGVFEVTLGARSAASSTEGASLLSMGDRLAAAAFILSWAGLSVHAQVAGLMGQTGWRYGPFARARLLHGVMAVVIAYLIWPYFSAAGSASYPTWATATRSAPDAFVWTLAAAAGTLALLAAAGAVALAVDKLSGRKRD